MEDRNFDVKNKVQGSRFKGCKVQGARHKAQGTLYPLNPLNSRSVGTVAELQPEPFEPPEPPEPLEPYSSLTASAGWIPEALSAGYQLASRQRAIVPASTIATSEK